MSIEQLAETAQAMVAAGKGIIAIDESTATIAKRFQGVGIENTEENRRAYREMLLTTPNLGQYISGAILFDETIRQSTKAGVPFARFASLLRLANSPPRISSQFGPHSIFSIRSPVIIERGRAVGNAGSSGAFCRCS